MSVKYVPVQWSATKYRYDAIMLAGVATFLGIFVLLVPGWLNHPFPVDAPIHNARAFGACAFVMLSVILAIGPLSRLDRRFLPLLYNRRHFGVMTLFVALTHAGYVLDWYFNFSPTPQLRALLSSNTSFAQLRGFPFEVFGIAALLSLMVLAVTSHDFWMKFLTPPVWKRLHYSVYAAYAAATAHVAFGILQDQQNPVLTAVMLIAAGSVATLHVVAAVQDRRAGDPVAAPADGGLVRVCDVGEIAEGRARVARLPSGDRVAVFRHQGKLSAISNACAHQNGPLGEGRILNCLVTCPWHGYQYDVTNGRSPAPFTETVPTYRVMLRGREVLVDPRANPPGTATEAVPIPEGVI